MMTHVLPLHLPVTSAKYPPGHSEMHLPSCNIVFSAQVRHRGLLEPQLLQDGSQAKGKENPSEKVNSQPREQRSLFFKTSTVGINRVISFFGCSAEFCLLDSNISKDSALSGFTVEEPKNYSSLSITNILSHAPAQYIQFNKGFKV